MKIAIVGLGLIGGSLAKAIKKNTKYTCYGLDINKTTITDALAQESIDAEITASEIGKCDVVIVCLYPQQTIDFILENKANFKKGALVIDTCGIKSSVVSALEQPLIDEGVRYVGCHPMAGREFSGFSHAVDNLFEKASFIIAATDKTPKTVIDDVTSLVNEIGFAKCVVSNPAEHDHVIAFTSQLAHVVSSAYIKSPSLMKQAGFSAGSFKDLTRVAKLNEDMWTPLFLMNREPLLEEISHIIKSLEDYQKAISENDYDKLHTLLKEGRELKEQSGYTTR